MLSWTRQSRRQGKGLALRLALYAALALRAQHAYIAVMQLELTNRSTAWLAQGALRPTRQRLALAQLLVGDGHNRHVTAEGLFAAAAGADEKVSLATVYNTLRAFCEAGLMNEIVVDGARSYFDTRMDDHPHFYWEDTARLTDAPAEALEIARLPVAPEGMQISRVDVVIRLRQVV